MTGDFIPMKFDIPDEDKTFAADLDAVLVGIATAQIQERNDKTEQMIELMLTDPLSRGVRIDAWLDAWECRLDSTVPFGTVQHNMHRTNKGE